MGKTVNCSDCGAEMDDEDATEVAGGTVVCKGCLENYTPCDDCEKFFVTTDLTRVESGNEVCPDCLAKKYKKCGDCGNYAPLSEIQYYSDIGENLCDGCREDNYGRCDNCDVLVPNDNLFFTDDNAYCESCYQELHTEPNTCIFCGNDTEEDDWICEICDSKHMRFAENAVPSEAVNCIYPDLSKRVDDMFMASVMVREMARGLGGAFDLLKSAFPGFTIDFVKLEYTDLVTGRKKDLSMLSSPRNKAFKAMCDNDQALVQNAVQLVYNKARDRKAAIEDLRVQALPIIFKAVRYRMYRETKVKGLREAIERVRGIYKHGEYFFDISDDPVDIMMKSTGQTWEGISCEKFTGAFKEGPASDIIRSNMVVFVRDSINGQALARIMIRWCEPSTVSASAKNPIAFGIESVWYYGAEQKAYGNHNDVMVLGKTSKLRADDARKVVESILTSAGVYEYKSCTTPYKYNGYSDTMGTGKTKITFEK